MGLHGHGLIVRFAPIPGVTPAQALRGAIRLPAVLNNAQEQDTALHSEYDTISAGQFSQPAMGPASARQLREYPLDSLLMTWDPKWFVWSGQEMPELEHALKSILHSKKPVHMLATFHPSGHVFADTNVTFRSFTRESRGGEVDTTYLNLDLKDWRDATVHRLSARGGGSGGGSGRPNLPTTHTLKADDTLYSLAKQYYGGYTNWRSIRSANGIATTVGGSAKIAASTRFSVGSKLKIPLVLDSKIAILSEGNLNAISAPKGIG